MALDGLPKPPASPWTSEAEIDGVVAGFEDGTLEKPRWTHFAHLTVTVHYLRRDGLARARAELPDRIRRYNTATGVPNSDTRGYHETITQVYLLAIDRYLTLLPGGTSRREAINGLLTSRFGSREFPFELYSRDLLLSVEARRRFVPPDLQKLERIAGMR